VVGEDGVLAEDGYHQEPIRDELLRVQPRGHHGIDAFLYRTERAAPDVVLDRRLGGGGGRPPTDGPAELI
jgi:hypothetical protein